MPRYKTTKAIKSLSQNGINLGKNQPVTPAAFLVSRWDKLISEGVIVEILPTPTQSETVEISPPLSGMTIKELKAIATEKGVSYPRSVKKTDLIKRINSNE